jgi:hypothetical protein
LHYASGIPRTVLLATLWPDSDSRLAAEALRGRVKSLHTRPGAALSGAAPVLQVDTDLRLNTAAGVSVDIARCDALATTGDRQTRAGDTGAAAAAYQHAIQLYHGRAVAQPPRVAHGSPTKAARHNRTGDPATCEMIVRRSRAMVGNGKEEDAQGRARRQHV